MYPVKLLYFPLVCSFRASLTANRECRCYRPIALRAAVLARDWGAHRSGLPLSSHCVRDTTAPLSVLAVGVILPLPCTLLKMA